MIDMARFYRITAILLCVCAVIVAGVFTYGFVRDRVSSHATTRTVTKTVTQFGSPPCTFC
jgi:hypothetical protein